MTSAALALLASAALAASPRASLLAADAAFDAALAARDEKAFLASLDPDAVFGGSTLAVGRDAVAARWARYLAPDGPTLRWKPTDAGVAASGDLGWTMGDAIYEWRSKGDRRPDLRYATVWRKDAGGRWRAVLDAPLVPAPPGEPLRTPVRTLVSRDGSMEASIGTYERTDGGKRTTGVYLRVRRRLGGDWFTVVSSEVPAG